MQQNPAETLRDIELIRTRTQQQLNHFWFPLMLFGGLSMVSAVVGAVYGGPAVGMFWLIFGPLGGAATGLYYHKRESRLGVETNPVPWIATAIGIMVGCFASGYGGGVLDLPVLSTLGPLLSIAAGYLIFGRLARSMAISVSAVVLAIAVLVMWLLGTPEVTSQIGAALYGALTFFIGFVSRRREVGRA